MTTPRQALSGLLEGHTPREWKVVYSERNVDFDDSSTVLQLLQQSLERHPKAGTGVHLIGFTATLTVGSKDPDKAEDLLDDQLLEFAAELDGLSIKWDRWSKAIYDGRLGYQAAIYLVATKEKSNGSND